MSKKTIVCDNGTGFCKVGYAGSNFPELIFPSLVGKPMMRYESDFENVELKDIMCGDEAAKYRAMLNTSYPVENGQVRDWEGMKHLWDYTFFEKLKIDPSEHKVLLTEPPLNPVENKKRMLENMFEKYGFAAAKVEIQAMLVLYALVMVSLTSFLSGTTPAPPTSSDVLMSLVATSLVTSLSCYRPEVITSTVPPTSRLSV